MPFLSPNATGSVQPGMVVVHQGNDVWLPYSQAVNTGGLLAIATTTAPVPGTTFSLVTTGDVALNIFNLGAGSATTVGISSGNFASRGTNQKNMLGYCDISGRITLLPEVFQASLTSPFPYINVKDYGAKGDGIADDTNAINAAIQGLSQFQGAAPTHIQVAGTIFFPAGVYMTSGITLAAASNSAGCFRLRGQGPSCPGKTHSNTGGTVIRAIGTQSFVIQVEATDWVISDLTIDGNLTATQPLVINPVSENGAIRDVVVTRAVPTTGDLVYLEGSAQGDTMLFDRVTFVQNFATVANPPRSCLYIHQNNAVSVQCVCCIFDRALDQVVLDSGAGVTLQSCTFTNDSPNNGVKVIGSAQQLIIDSCTCEGSNGQFLYVSSPNSTYAETAIIRGNDISYGGPPGRTDLPSINWPNTQNLIMEGNLIGSYVVVGNTGTAFTISIGDTLETGRSFTGAGVPSQLIQIGSAVLGGSVSTVLNSLQVIAQALYLGVTTPGLNNFALLCDGSSVVLNAPSNGGSVAVNLNNVTYLQVDTAALHVGTNADRAGGVGVIALKECTTPPPNTPIGAGVLFVSSGALKYKGTSGTVTTIAPA